MATQRLGGKTGTPSPRKAAFALLRSAGFPTGTMTTNTGVVAPIPVVMVATAESESDLYVDAVGPINKDGSTDRGWLQLNSVHGYDNDRLVTDALYTARMAQQVYAKQGLGAWAAYGFQHTEEPVYRYLRRMPPAYGGPEIFYGQTNERFRSVQEFLNVSGLLAQPLVTDANYGYKSKQAVTLWKALHHNDGHTVIDGRTWLAMVARGLL